MGSGLSFECQPYQPTRHQVFVVLSIRWRAKGVQQRHCVAVVFIASGQSEIPGDQPLGTPYSAQGLGLHKLSGAPDIESKENEDKLVN